MSEIMERVAQIRAEIMNDLCGYGLLDEDKPERLNDAVDAIMAGQIRNVKVVY